MFASIGSVFALTGFSATKFGKRVQARVPALFRLLNFLIALLALSSLATFASFAAFGPGPPRPSSSRFPLSVRYWAPHNIVEEIVAAVSVQPIA